MPQSRVVWNKTVRIVPTRFPPIALFERVADPADFEALLEIEALTNERIRDEVGEVSLVPVQDRVSGPGASWVMAAFTHLGRPSRFGDGSFGIYYTAQSEACAIAETCYHWARFFAATEEPASDIDMRVLIARLDATLLDLRGREKEFPLLYLKEDYTHAQIFGKAAREAGSNGIVYSSVRCEGAQCAALFKPRTIKRLPVGDRVLRYHWNGERIDRIFDFQAEEWREASIP